MTDVLSSSLSKSTNVHKILNKDFIIYFYFEKLLRIKYISRFIFILFLDVENEYTASIIFI
jgi:hypothetical protein